MFGILSVRVVSAAAVFLFALFTAALASLPSLPTTSANSVEAGSVQGTPLVEVNRALKADRLQGLPASIWQAEFTTPLLPPSKPKSAAQMQRRALVPPGCDPAFSPISAPRLANVLGRCIT